MSFRARVPQHVPVLHVLGWESGLVLDEGEESAFSFNAAGRCPEHRSGLQPVTTLRCYPAEAGSRTARTANEGTISRCNLMRATRCRSISTTVKR